MDNQNKYSRLLTKTMLKSMMMLVMIMMTAMLSVAMVMKQSNNGFSDEVDDDEDDDHFPFQSGWYLLQKCFWEELYQPLDFKSHGLIVSDHSTAWVYVSFRVTKG